jgi:hypothetical protein
MKRLAAAMFLILVLAFALIACGPSQRKSGNNLIVKIDEFRKSKGHLPNSLSEIGTEESESCPCYCKTGESGYIIWYGTTLGESDTYDSQTKKWSEVGQHGVCSH